MNANEVLILKEEGHDAVGCAIRAAKGIGRGPHGKS